MLHRSCLPVIALFASVSALSNMAHDAAYEDDDQTVIQVAKALGINEQNRLEGNTVAHIAVIRKNLSLLKWLAEQGADLGIRNFEGKSVLDLVLVSEDARIRDLFKPKDAKQEKIDKKRDFDPANRRVPKGANPKTSCFFPEEIIAVEQNLRVESVHLAGLVDLYQGEHEVFPKHVLQQPLICGCGPAVVNMVLLDFGQKPDMEYLFDPRCENPDSINFGTNAQMHGEVFARYGLQTAIFRVSKTPIDNHISFEQLMKMLETKSEDVAVIVGISDPVIQGHWIIVDQVIGDRVLIRDPFHGWRIWVTRKALERRMKHESAAMAEFAIFVSAPQKNKKRKAANPGSAIQAMRRNRPTQENDDPLTRDIVMRVIHDIQGNRPPDTIWLQTLPTRTLAHLVGLNILGPTSP